MKTKQKLARTSHFLLLFTAIYLVTTFSIMLYGQNKTYAQQNPRCYAPTDSGDVYQPWNEDCPSIGEGFEGDSSGLVAEEGACYLIYLGVAKIDCNDEKIGSATNSGSLEASAEIQSLADNPIIKLLTQVLNFLTVGVGIVVTITIISGGIQYMVSQGNPQQTAAAQQKITWAIIALVLYIFAYAIIQWLIPGGVFA